MNGQMRRRVFHVAGWQNGRCLVRDLCALAYRFLALDGVADVCGLVTG